MDNLDVQNQSGDDQELAKALAGLSQGSDGINPTTLPAPDPSMPIPPMPPTDHGMAGAPPVIDSHSAAYIGAPTAPVPQADPAVVSVPEPARPVAAPATPSDATHPLTGVKEAAIVELRPLIDKLDVAPEEKFDTYLLLIRSTDDQSLIAPAHEVAKSIPDEARRAQALLDIIKEIDFLSASAQ